MRWPTIGGAFISEMVAMSTKHGTTGPLHLQFPSSEIHHEPIDGGCPISSIIYISWVRKVKLGGWVASNTDSVSHGSGSCILNLVFSTISASLTALTEQKWSLRTEQGRADSK